MLDAADRQADPEENARGRNPASRAISLGRRNALAARYYAAFAARRGHCYTADLVEAGFREGPLLDHWPAIRAAGERLLAKVARRAPGHVRPARGVEA